MRAFRCTYDVQTPWIDQQLPANCLVVPRLCRAEHYQSLELL
jgi:hypothetical protein